MIWHHSPVCRCGIADFIVIITGTAEGEYILFYLTISITHSRNNLPYILLSILRFSPTNPTISDSLSCALLLNGRLYQPRNNGISAVVSIFIRSWIGVSRR